MTGNMRHKIALVTYGFTGSTFPLAKALMKRGCKVDIYILNYIGFDDLEAFDCKYVAKNYGIVEIPNSKWHSMYEYLTEDLEGIVRLYSMKMPRPFLTVPVLRNIISIYTTIYDVKVARFINSQEYDVINFIGAYFSHNYLPIIKRLTSKVVFSLHEVCNHNAPDFESPSPLLKYLFNNNVEIVVYSDNSLNHILNYKSVNRDKIKRLNFGLFDSYKTFPTTHNLQLPEEYILFYGSILPYKGLGILYEAYKSKKDILPKLVVAGKGHDLCLDEMNEDDRCVVINRRLSNQEICELINRSKFVVCPYISMSQSGIPQTVYSFAKPIIASDLDGFKEVVDNNCNGLLFANGDVAALAQCLVRMATDLDLYKSFTEELSAFESRYPDYAWGNIADKFISYYINC